jgi:hypothetical protein
MAATEIARLFARVGADISDFESKMRTVDRTAKQTGESMDDDLGGGADMAAASLLKLATAGGVAMGVIKGIAAAVDKAKGLQDLAQKTDMVADAYERLAGIDVASGMERLRAATQGSLSDFELQSRTMQLMSMHLADSNQEAAKLLSIATQLSRLKDPRGGGNIDALLPMLTNQSALRLDEFLVSGDAVKKLQDAYKAAGMDSGDAFMKAFVVEAQKTLDAAGPVQVTYEMREAAAEANIKQYRAQAFNEGPWGQALGAGREAMLSMREDRADRLQAVAAERQMLNQYQQEISALQAIGKLTDDQTAKLRTALWQMEQAGAGAWGGVSAADISAFMESAAGGALDVARAGGQIADELSNAAAQAEHLDLVLRGIASHGTDAAYELKVAGWRVTNAATQRYQGMADEYALSRAMMTPPTRDDEAMGYGGGTPSNPLSNAQQVARLLDKMPKATSGSGGSGYSTARADAERRAREFESFVSGLLQPTQVTAADMAATEMGVYGDKWDEYMRRFRVGKNPYEIQQEERAFYGGQRMGDVNWEALLGAGREEAQFRQGQQALLSTAMDKFAEAGIGLGREQVAGLLGLPQDYAAIGADRSADLLAGLTDTDMGKAVTTAFEAQIVSEASRWMAIGEDMAEWLQEGMETTTAGGSFLRAVIDAVLPELHEVLSGMP